MSLLIASANACAINSGVAFARDAPHIDRVPGIAEVDVQNADLACPFDRERRGRGLDGPPLHRCVIGELYHPRLHLGADEEDHRVPRDRRVFLAADLDGTTERVVHLQRERESDAREIGAWQRLAPQVVVVIEGALNHSSTAKSSAAWKMPEMDTPVADASWSVVVAPRPEKPCN